ncbi:MAG: lipase [Oscillochloris sp.]|nr:lipase [Oscillochloris sp.]
MSTSSTPILIVGGFASRFQQYDQLRDLLAEISRRPVEVAPIGLIDWVGVAASDSYGALLRLLHRAITTTLARHRANRLTLVAHSAGGVLARIYMGDRPYSQRKLVYSGHGRVDGLVSLGTPHTTAKLGRVGGLNQIGFVQDHYPGAFWPEVQYVSVCGTAIQGDAAGSVAAKRAFRNYLLIAGRGDTVGDGIVPLESGLLAGSRRITMPGIYHSPNVAGLWYGSNHATVRAWWEQVEHSAP